MARAERITLQEASELSGVSIPTIYRRIRSGELRGAICIDAGGKHWELFKSDLPKLTLKRKKRSTEALPAVPVAQEISLTSIEEAAPTTELPAVDTIVTESELLAEPQTDTGANNMVEFSTFHKLSVENEVLKARCADLEDRLKHLREELDSAKDDASYWRGRWEEISLNFEALRKMLEDKNSEDQELIWELRGQVADLQDERLENEQAAPAEVAKVEEYSVPNVEEEQIQLDSFPTATYQAFEDEPRTTAEILYDPNITNIDKSVNLTPEAEAHEEIYPEPDFGDISSSSLTSADDINPVNAYNEVSTDLVAQEAISDSETAEKESSLPTDNGEQAEEESENREDSGSKLASFSIARNIKFSMRHPKGRQGKRGRKRIPPLR